MKLSSPNAISTQGELVLGLIWRFNTRCVQEIWHLRRGDRYIKQQPQSQGQFMALGTAGRWIRLMHPISTPVPYLWMDTVPWYRKYQCSNSTILGSLCFSFTILAETLTVDDVITSEWRHYSHFGDVMWLDLISSDVTLVPLWSCQVLSLTGRF